MNAPKVATQGGVAYGGYAVADDSSVIIPDHYVSIFDQLWILGVDGNDWVRLGGVLVLGLTCVNLVFSIRKNLKNA